MKTQEELESAIRQAYNQAESWNDYLGTIRVRLLKAYNGEPYGNEREGRSRIVMTDVRDTVSAVLPSLMRAFFGSQKAVEFVPNDPSQAEIAEQATDYVTYVLRQDNPGFVELYRWFKDALIGGIGVLKVWWESDNSVKKYEFSGLDPTAAALIQQETSVSPDVSIQISSQDKTGLSGTVMYRNRNEGVRIRAVPPEEFLIEPGAVHLNECKYAAHRTLQTISDLVALGYDREKLLEHATNQSRTDVFGQERIYRWGNLLQDELNPIDDSQRYVLYVEHYVLIDSDDDGIAERHRICTIGEDMEIVNDEVVDEIPFVVVMCDPEPHQLVGSSLAERVEDVQRIRTAVVRGVLDSLSQAIVPRIAVVEGQASLADVLNTDVGAPIRMAAPGMVAPLATPFVGKEAIPLLGYLDEVKENRTGVTKAAVGLDPDSLQSATQAAVAATVKGAQERVELLARLFAESGVAPLYRLIYRLLYRNQRAQRVVRLRGRWVPVNPSSWVSDLQVSVLVGIGEATIQERIQTLLGLAAKIEKLLEMLGPSNPIVPVRGYRDLLAEAAEMSGIYNTGKFFPPVTPQAEQAMAEAASKPDPEKEVATMVAQVQVEQIKADISMKQAELKLKEQDVQLKHEREMKQMAVEAELKMAELKMKYEIEKEKLKNANASSEG